MTINLVDFVNGIFQNPITAISVIGGAILLVVILIVIIAVSRKRRKNRIKKTASIAPTELVEPVQTQTLTPEEIIETSESDSNVNIADSGEADDAKEKTIQPTSPLEQETSPETVTEKKSEIVLNGVGGFFHQKQLVSDEIIIIGRNPQRCTHIYPKDEKGISAVHCRLQYDGGHILLTDLGSQFGTFVNGQRLQPNTPFILQKGDSFWLAERSNTFYVP